MGGFRSPGIRRGQRFGTLSQFSELLSIINHTLFPRPVNGLLHILGGGLTLAPRRGKTDGKGNLTAAQLGFSAAQDGTITCNSDRLYELFETNMLHACRDEQCGCAFNSSLIKIGNH